MKILEYKELSASLQNLILSSQDARDLAYAPYSSFHVGVSILLANGEIIQGANQENASYPLCLCGERVALSYSAMHRPGIEILTMSISTSAVLTENQPPAAPCGACRQVLFEYQQRQNKPIEIILPGYQNKTWIYSSIDELLPHSFGGDYFEK